MKSHSSIPSSKSERLKMWGLWVRRWARTERVVIAAIVAAYLLLFFPLYEEIGTGAFALALVVVLVTGVLSGLRVALWMSAFLYLLGIGLSLAVGASMFFATIGGLPGLAAMLLVGARVGHFRDINVRLRNEIVVRSETEAALREANEQLSKYVKEIEGLQTSLREQVVRDSLTGLYNRRYLDETLERELLRARRVETQSASRSLTSIISRALTTPMVIKPVTSCCRRWLIIFEESSAKRILRADMVVTSLSWWCQAQ